ncbi:hypothetical protein [Flavobacterium pectinovorum]|uniref:hypothetical protein n=1 Tax=Flavobacterium pectinovorum TaxID=29533 RepID=UPI001FAD0A04|nr:hypothetical protein [Flavobacterium pectinovorum]MCI9844545.1 hypothetical protein [Flavobacterium pectinovorum]
MKKNILCTIVYLLCIVSCTTDTVIQNSDAKSRKENSDFVVQNGRNISDTQAKKYYEIINSYRNKDGFPETVEELTLQIKAIEAIIQKQLVNDNVRAVNTIVPDILKDPKGNLEQMIQKQNISFAVQESLLELTSLLLETSADKQTNFSNDISTYELEVIQNEILNEEDKKVVLSLVSISQLLVSKESGRKDRDWEKAMTNKKKQAFVQQREVSIVTFIVLINNLISLR